MTWLVTGGAGYIGQHVVRVFLARGHEVVVLDDLSSGRADLLPAGVQVVEASVVDYGAVAAALRSAQATGVVHLAGLKAADESLSRPLDYYRVNTAGTGSLLRAMVDTGVSTLLFSSSAAVYGDAASGLVSETSPTDPINPYGSSKLMAERIIADAARAHGLSWVALRYFNVAGAQTGELVDRGERNLIPRVLRAVRAGQRPTVFGRDYPTPDGTCVRDYVHVSDLASAHLVAAERASSGGAAEVYNVGCGRGASVLEVLDCVRRVTGSDLAPRLAPRRPGDPAKVVADVTAIGRTLGWAAECDLDDMVSSTWDGLAGG
jgi:UDP-glucose 4-epimerase